MAPAKAAWRPRSRAGVAELLRRSQDIVDDIDASVRRLADEGIAMLITDHNVQQTLRICDRAFIIHEGKNLSEGTPRAIINDPVVRDAYLASTFRGDEFDDHPAERQNR